MLQPSAGIADSDTLSLTAVCGLKLVSLLTTTMLLLAIWVSLCLSLLKDFGSVKFIEHQFLVVKEQVRQWAWCFCLEKLWSIRYLACKSQEQVKFYEHKVHEPATVCSTHRPEILQRIDTADQEHDSALVIFVHREISREWPFY